MFSYCRKNWNSWIQSTILICCVVFLFSNTTFAQCSNGTCSSVSSFSVDNSHYLQSNTTYRYVPRIVRPLGVIRQFRVFRPFRPFRNIGCRRCMSYDIPIETMEYTKQLVAVDVWGISCKK